MHVILKDNPNPSKLKKFFIVTSTTLGTAYAALGFGNQAIDDQAKKRPVEAIVDMAPGDHAPSVSQVIPWASKYNSKINGAAQEVCEKKGKEGSWLYSAHVGVRDTERNEILSEPRRCAIAAKNLKAERGV